MINTIFYFPSSLTYDEYRTLLDNGEISSYTIVFASEQTAIYKGGKSFGVSDATYTRALADLEARINELIEQARIDMEEADEQSRRDLEAAEAQLNSLIDNLTQTVDDMSADLDKTSQDLTDLIEGLDGEISSSIEAALKDPSGKSVWTRLATVDDGLSALTTRVNTSLDTRGNLKNTEVLQTYINAGVTNSTAVSEIANRWAVADENQEVIEWMASGFKSQAAEGGSFSEIYAAGKTDTDSAIARAKTEVLQDVDGNYVANANLSSQVTNELNNAGANITSLADIATKATVNSASATLSARIDSLDGNSGSSLAAVKATADEAKARAEVVTQLGDNNTYIFNESTLDGAVAGLLAKSGSSTKAGVETVATGDAAQAIFMAKNDFTGASIIAAVNGETSQITIDADKVNITGQLLADKISAEDLTLTGAVTASNANISGTVNANAGTIGGWSIMNGGSIVYNETDSQNPTYMNHISLNPNFQASGNKGITLFHRKTNTTGVRPGSEVVLDLDGLRFTTFGLDGTGLETNRISMDGSGSLGGGGITWDENGNFAFSNDVVGTLQISKLYASSGTMQAKLSSTGFAVGEGIADIDNPDSVSRQTLMSPAAFYVIKHEGGSGERKLSGFLFPDYIKFKKEEALQDPSETSYSKEGITTDASSFDIAGENNITITAGDDVSISAETDATISAREAMYVKSTGNDVYVQAENNVSVSANAYVYITAEEDIKLTGSRILIVANGNTYELNIAAAVSAGILTPAT